MRGDNLSVILHPERSLQAKAEITLNFDKVPTNNYYINHPIT
jgi:hypothetical protein